MAIEFQEKIAETLGKFITHCVACKVSITLATFDAIGRSVGLTRGTGFYVYAYAVSVVFVKGPNYLTKDSFRRASHRN